VLRFLLFPALYCSIKITQPQSLLTTTSPEGATKLSLFFLANRVGITERYKLYVSYTHRLFGQALPLVTFCLCCTVHPSPPDGLCPPARRHERTRLRNTPALVVYPPQGRFRHFFRSAGTGVNPGPPSSPWVRGALTDRRVSTPKSHAGLLGPTIRGCGLMSLGSQPVAAEAVIMGITYPESLASATGAHIPALAPAKPPADLQILRSPSKYKNKTRMRHGRCPVACVDRRLVPGTVGEYRRIVPTIVFHGDPGQDVAPAKTPDQIISSQSRLT